MSKKSGLHIQTCLAAVLGAYCLIGILLRVIAPLVMYPEPDLPMMTAISLVAMLIEAFTGREKFHNPLLCAVFSFLTFGLFLWGAGFVSGIRAAALTGLFGCLVFVVTGLMFDGMAQRAEAVKGTKGALLVNAFVLYLASQVLSGLI